MRRIPTVMIATILCLSAAALANEVRVTSDSAGFPKIPTRYYTYTPEIATNPVNVALFRDDLPWGSNRDVDILTANSIAFTIYGSADIGVVDLSPFDKVIISNQQSLSFVQTVAANTAWFESYVADGGCLLNGMSHYQGDIPVGTTFPGQVVYGPEYCNNTVTIDAPLSPIFNVPNLIAPAQLQNWGCSSHADISDAGVTLLSNADFTTGPAVREQGWGQGLILSTTQPYQYGGADLAYAENIVLYFPCAPPVSVEDNSWGSVKSLYR